MVKIVPILLCGGSGTRLWPLSRKTHPKQFSNIVGNKSLLQATAILLKDSGFADPIAVTCDSLRFITTDQLADVGVTAQKVIIEPEGRNTGPAVLAATLIAEVSDPDALVLVMPSDHVIPDVAAFADTVKRAQQAAINGRIVTFGIVPTHAETGYGWLEMGADYNANAPSPLVRFVEKPDSDTAQKMLESGNFLWNAGIFLMSVKCVRQAYETNASDLVATVTQSVADAELDMHFTRLAIEPWLATRDISIDYAIMERANNLSVMPFDAGWSDLGSWEAVFASENPDADGNVVTGAAVNIDCKNTMLRSESDGLALVGIGLENIVAIAMPDAVLIARAGSGQSVKKAVAILQSKNVKQATDFPVDYRPWGWFERLAIGPRFQVKRIVVKPGGVLSLQSHHHRSEHWIVVEGTAKVTVDGKAKLVSENESVYIPLGATHRMENPGKVPMVLIEVQTGSYLGEDDIVRYEDIYSRK